MKFKLTGEEVARLCAQDVLDSHELPDGDYRVETAFEFDDAGTLTECTVTFRDKSGEN
jgi:hypothetical protein